VTPHFVYVSSGAGRTVDEYEALWAELSGRGAQITLAAHDADDVTLPVSVTPKAIPLTGTVNPLRDAATMAVLVAALDGLSVDVMHATDLRSLPSAAAARKIARVPFLFATLSNTPAAVASMLSSRLTELPKRRGVARVLRQAGVDRFVALHRGIAETWAEAGIPPNSIELLESGFGIDVEAWQNDGARSAEQSDARAEAGWRRARLIVACAPEQWDTRTEKRLRAIALRLASHVPSAQLFVHVQEGASRQAPDGPWTLAPSRELLFRAADMLLAVDAHVSRPTAVMEASAARVPVIAHDCAGLRALVRDGFNGLVVDGDDVLSVAAAITQLAGDAEMREQMGARARSMMRRTADRDLAAQQQLRAYDAVFREKVGEPLHVSLNGQLFTPSESEAQADAAARRVRDLTS
jgi:glycosyltransferase involved in cell wall biosynthesis